MTREQQTLIPSELARGPEAEEMTEICYAVSSAWRRGAAGGAYEEIGCPETKGGNTREDGKSCALSFAYLKVCFEIKSIKCNLCPLLLHVGILQSLCTHSVIHIHILDRMVIRNDTAA